MLPATPPEARFASLKIFGQARSATSFSTRSRRPAYGVPQGGQRQAPGASTRGGYAVIAGPGPDYQRAILNSTLTNGTKVNLKTKALICIFIFAKVCDMSTSRARPTLIPYNSHPGRPVE